MYYYPHSISLGRIMSWGISTLFSFSIVFLSLDCIIWSDWLNFWCFAVSIVVKWLKQTTYIVRKPQRSQTEKVHLNEKATLISFFSIHNFFGKIIHLHVRLISLLWSSFLNSFRSTSPSWWSNGRCRILVPPAVMSRLSTSSARLNRFALFWEPKQIFQINFQCSPSSPLIT